MRAQLMKFLIMQTNALRDLLYEFGEVLPDGYRAFSQAIFASLTKVTDHLPSILIDSPREQWSRVQAIDGEIAVLERRLSAACRDNDLFLSVPEIAFVSRGAVFHS
jgi:hypothetical protein